MIFTSFSKVYSVTYQTNRKPPTIRTAVLIVKSNMLNWNSNRELDRASISNSKAPGLEIQKENCSILSFISDAVDDHFKSTHSVFWRTVSK